MEIKELLTKLKDPDTNNLNIYNRQYITRLSKDISQKIKYDENSEFIVAMEELIELIDAFNTYPSFKKDNKKEIIYTPIMHIYEETADVNICISRCCSIMNIEDITTLPFHHKTFNITDNFSTEYIIFNLTQSAKSISKYIRYKGKEESIKNEINMINNLINTYSTINSFIESYDPNSLGLLENIMNVKYIRQYKRVLAEIKDWENMYNGLYSADIEEIKETKNNEQIPQITNW